MKEIDLMHAVQLEAPKHSARLLRNNVGLFKTQDGRTIRTGLCIGSADLIGWTSLIITPEMVGKPVAVFTAVEVKGERTRTTAEQVYFVQAVRAAGGFAGIAKSVEEAVKILHV